MWENLSTHRPGMACWSLPGTNQLTFFALYNAILRLDLLANSARATGVISCRAITSTEDSHRFGRGRHVWRSISTCAVQDSKAPGRCEKGGHGGRCHIRSSPRFPVLASHNHPGCASMLLWSPESYLIPYLNIPETPGCQVSRELPMGTRLLTEMEPKDRLGDSSQGFT